MNPSELAKLAEELATRARELLAKLEQMAVAAKSTAVATQQVAGLDPFLIGITVFVLACFVGYYVVWRVTPALHSPLMAVTNAISSVIIVGALLAAGPADLSFAKVMGVIAIALAAVNIFGGFIVTQRMLGMFHKKKPR
ncbi:MAG: NAD(P) transhydrogenase subunit alpha [Dongiaceae bacterium]